MAAELFITRPLPDAERTCAALADVGITAHPTPLMSIDPLPAALPSTNEDDVLIFTSANGVRQWAGQDHRRPPSYCVGDATAEQARQAGFPVLGIGGGDIETLMPVLLRAPAAIRFIHVRGEHARGDVTGQLAKAGRTAVGLSLYRASPVGKLPAQLVKAFAGNGPFDIGIFSPRTMRIFCGLLSPEQMSTLDRVRAFCLSPAIAAAAQGQPFQGFHVAEQPTLDAFIDMVRLQRT